MKEKGNSLTFRSVLDIVLACINVTSNSSDGRFSCGCSNFHESSEIDGEYQEWSNDTCIVSYTKTKYTYVIQHSNPGATTGILRPLELF